MPRVILLILCCVMLLSACATATDDDSDLPTVAVLPTETATEEILPTDTPEPPTNTPSPTHTFTPSPTNTPTITPTPSDTMTPTATRTPAATATPRRVTQSASVATIEPPRISTLTPAPVSGGNPGGVVAPPQPVVVADVIITERQMQTEVSRLLTKYRDIENAIISYEAGQGINVEMSARAGGAVSTGTVLIRFALVGEAGTGTRFLQVTIADPEEFVMSGGGMPSDEFVNVAYSELFSMIGEAFGTILDQRLGTGQHDLEFIQITDDEMGVSLYVPEPGS